MSIPFASFFSSPRVKGTSNYDQTTVTINDFGLQRKDRTSKSTGVTKSRFTVSIDATPLTHYCDAVSLGRGPAEAIAEHLRTRIKTLQVEASNATQKRRETAAVAFARGGSVPKATGKGAKAKNARATFEAGAASVMQRYSGGRMGPMAPNQSTKLFNDSGRLADSLIAKPARPTPGQQAEAQWIINVAANRFDPTTFGGGQAAISVMFIRLAELIPEFSDPARLVNIPSVQAAITDSYKALMGRNADLRSKLSRTRTQAFRAMLSVFR
jgi:hypothetical protein